MAWFRISFAEKAFLRILDSHARSLESITVDEGVTAMVEFYREHRAQHSSIGDRGDGLLLRWSPTRVDVSRRLQRAGDPANPVMLLRLRFAVSSGISARGQRTIWDPARAMELPSFAGARSELATLSYAAA